MTPPIVASDYKCMVAQTFSLSQVTNLANASAVIYHELRSLEHFQKKPLNWAGFYVVDPTNAEKLILGPFQGKVREKKSL